MSASADISKFLAGLKQADEQIRARARKRMGQFAAKVIGDSQELCPVDTGALAASATQGEVQTASDDTMTVQIGHNTDYAAAVHERLDVHHEQGQAKFLETALRNNQPKLLPFVGEGLMGKG